MLADLGWNAGQLEIYLELIVVKAIVIDKRRSEF